MRRGFTLIEVMVVLLIIFLLGALSAFPMFLLTGLYHMLAGWLYYLFRTLPEVHPQWSAILTFLVAILALLYLLHSFLRWLSKKLADTAAPATWRWSWTIKCVTLVLLAFAAGICAVGMVHQVGWLTSSKYPVIESQSGVFRDAARKMLSGSNMRQLVIAMHNYHSDYDHLPPVFTSSKEGKPLLSWRVLILPYLEQDELFRKFKLDEPWDSPHNRTVLEQNPMPQIFEHPNKRDGDTKQTYYRALYSKPEAKLAAGLTYGQKLTLGTVSKEDGTATSALLLEGDPVLWTKPEDIEFDAKRPLPVLSPHWFHNMCQIALFDTSIRSVRHQLAVGYPAVFKALLTRNGGEKEQIDILFD